VFLIKEVNSFIVLRTLTLDEIFKTSVAPRLLPRCFYAKGHQKLLPHTTVLPEEAVA
jgi:hypothetical protein